MKITFPHMGDAHLYGRILFSELGIEIVTPPANTLNGLEKGSEMSPDEICIPFKLMLANLMEAHRLGADTVIMPATMGPCRLGEYAELLKSILDKRGYIFQWILLDAASAIGKKELLRRLRFIVSDSPKRMPEILQALRGTFKIIKNLELLEQRAHMMAGYETEQGACKKELSACRRELTEAGGIESALNILRRHLRNLENIPLDFNRQPLELLVAGEIFSMIEPFANHHIEDLLMDMGVSFQKKVTIGWWFNNLFSEMLHYKQIFGEKNDYMPYAIGGYAQATVEEGIQCIRNGFDGIIQIFPVGCMPEIVAKAVFSKMMREESLSILTVIYDEMGGEAGYITRIEAFVDMLERRRKAEGEKKQTSGFIPEVFLKKHRGKTNALSGH